MALAMNPRIIRLLEAVLGTSGPRLVSRRNPALPGKQLEAVRTAVEPDQAIGSPQLAVGAVESSCS